jgi:hypothetical protein
VAKKGKKTIAKKEKKYSDFLLENYNKIKKVQVSLAIRGGYVLEKFQTANSKKGI